MSEDPLDATLLELLYSLIEGRRRETQDPNVLHYHRCGRIALSNYKSTFDRTIGCGYVWEHATAPNGVSYVEHHKCPMCKRGPWYLVSKD